MGNTLGRRTAKVMKIDGQILKFKTPARVADIIKDYPDYVLMDSEAVRHLGVRAKALAVDHELKPRRLYFLVQLPKVKDEKVPRRARSGVLKMSAKDRLESLMLSRRSVSDLTHLKLMAPAPVGDESGEGTGGAVRVKMRLAKAQVTKLMEESKDAAEVAEKIMDLCIGDAGEDGAPKEDGGLANATKAMEACTREHSGDAKDKRETWSEIPSFTKWRIGIATHTSTHPILSI